MPIADLTPNAANPRKITRARKAQLRKSLEQFGNLSPITWNKTTGRIIGGNQRLEGYRDLGHMEVDVWVVELDEAREKAAVVALNNHAGEWEQERLAALIAEINDGGGDVELTGFETLDIDKLLNSIQGCSDVDAEVDASEKNLNALVAKWGVKLGQVWELGVHRLTCGDSSEKSVVEKTVGDSVVTTLLYDPEWDQKISVPIATPRHVIAFTDCQRLPDVIGKFGSPTWMFVWDCVTSWFTPGRPLKRGKLALWFGPIGDYNQNGAHYGDSGDARDVCNSRGKYRFVPDPRGKHLSDVFQTQITKLHSESEHNHSKPLDWIRMLIGNCTTGTIFDPFIGSGTTIIACEQLSRKCRAIELNPQYVAVALERWSKATGKVPVLNA